MRLRSSIRMLGKPCYHHLSDTQPTAAGKRLGELLLSKFNQRRIHLVVTAPVGGEPAATCLARRAQHLLQEHGLEVRRSLANLGGVVLGFLPEGVHSPGEG